MHVCTCKLRIPQSLEKLFLVDVRVVFEESFFSDKICLLLFNSVQIDWPRGVMLVTHRLLDCDGGQGFGRVDS